MHSKLGIMGARKFIKKCWIYQPKFIQKFHLRATQQFPGGGGALVFQAGYHPRKRTFRTHPKHVFFMYENRP